MRSPASATTSRTICARRHRVRLRLERGRDHAATLEELQTVADQAISGLDQSLAIITALLRIANRT